MTTWLVWRLGACSLSVQRAFSVGGAVVETETSVQRNHRALGRKIATSQAVYS